MADQPLTAREFEEILRRMNEGGGRRAMSGGGAENDADRLGKVLDQTASSMQNYLSIQKEYTKRQQAGSFVAGLFNKSTESSSRNMGQLRNAIAQHERALDELTAQGHTATSTQYKKVQSDLKVLKGQESLYQTQAAGAEIIRNASSQIFQTFLRLGEIQAEYQANLLNIVQQGGSGFQMAAASMENAVNQMHAMQSTMAQMAQSAGNSLGQLGGKFAPLAGLALTALGQAAQAAANAAKTLAMAQIRIMAAEGEKLIKTHHELTNTGVIYANGLQGIINATHGTKLRLEEMSAVVAKNRENFAAMGLGMSRATDLIGGVAKKFASTTGQFARMDRQLLALGFSYQEQAELAADSAAMLSIGGRKTNEKEVAEATVEMAKSMRLMGEVAGIDLAEKKKAIQAQQQEFFIKGQLAKMARDEPEKYKAFQKQLVGMTEQQQKAAYQMQFYGTVVDKNLAIQMATNSGFRKTVHENNAALKNGTASTEQAARTRQKYAQEELDQSINLSGTIGKAANALGSFSEVAKNMASSMDEAATLLKVDIGQAKRAVEKQMAAAAQPSGTDPTSLVLTAVEKGAIAAKNLQEEVIKRLPRLASALEDAYRDAMRTLRGEGGGSGIPDPTGLLAWAQKHIPELIAAFYALKFALDAFGPKLSGAFQNLKDKIFKPKLPGSGGIVPEGAASEAPEAPGKESRAERRRRERAERRAPGGTKGKLPSMSPLPSTVTPGVPAPGGGGGGGGSGLGGMLGELADGLKKFGPALKSIGVGIGDALAGFLRGLAGGLTAFANPMVVAGSVGFGVAIAAVGAGIAGASWLLGKALPTLSKGLASFNDVDGKALVDVGLGTAALGAGLLVFGAGSAVGGVGNVIGSIADGLGSLFGGKDIVTKLKEFSTLGPGLGKTGEGLTAMAGAMVKFQTSLTSFTRIDIKPLDNIIEKLKQLKEAAKPPEVSVVDAAKNVIASTLNAAANLVNPPTTSRPSGPPAAEFTSKDQQNIQTWVDGVNSGRFSIDQVPAPYRAEVAKLIKSRAQPTVRSTTQTKATTTTTTATTTKSPTDQTRAKPDSAPADKRTADQTRTKPDTAPVNKRTTDQTRTKPDAAPTTRQTTTGTPVEKPGSTPPSRVTLGSMPGKTALTAAEKANAMETVAGNTKYTNDLLIASQKNIENLNKIMIQKLESIVSATEAAAGYGKKTARNTS